MTNDERASVRRPIFPDRELPQISGSCIQNPADEKPVLFLLRKSYAKRAGVRLPERVVGERAMRCARAEGTCGVPLVSAHDCGALFELHPS